MAYWKWLVSDLSKSIRYGSILCSDVFTPRNYFISRVNYMPPIIMAKKFYAVKKGRTPGVYETWDQCKSQIDQFSEAEFKKFPTEEAAWNFVMDLESINFDNNLTESPDAEKTKISGKHSPKQPDHPTTSSSCTQKYPRQKRGIQIIAPLHSNLCKKRKKELKPCSHKRSKSLIGPLDPSLPTVYTDGACENNGMNEASAGIGVYWGPNHELNTSERLPGRQTNNRAEIHAAVKAIEQAKSLGLTGINLVTDSSFLIKGITEWIDKWKTNGWKLSNGKDVINTEDFQVLDKAREGIHINWIKVGGHTGNEGNEMADSLARAGIRKSVEKTNVV